MKSRTLTTARGILGVFYCLSALAKTRITIVSPTENRRMTNMTFPLDELRLLQIAVGAYSQHYTNVRDTVETELGGGLLSPIQFNTLEATKIMLERTAGVISQAISEHQTSGGAMLFSIDKDLLPLLKRSYLFWRRNYVRMVQARKNNVIDIAFNEAMDDEVKKANTLEATKSLRNITPAPMLRLTDFFTLQRAESILTKRNQLRKQPGKNLDDKFGILSPSRDVKPELEYWREQCDLRGIGLALAYMDVDDFKKNFNSKYGENLIDLVCLPVIMRHLEAAVFNHGSAFREGGDEFIVILPNVDLDHAIGFLDDLRIGVQQLEFQNVSANATFSIGVCHVDQDSSWTDAEMIEKANGGKMLAKKDYGKNCIVSWGDDGYKKVRPTS
jgi:diguanylate cyclase (GGDEF)-like protein